MRPRGLHPAAHRARGMGRLEHPSEDPLRSWRVQLQLPAETPVTATKVVCSAPARTSRPLLLSIPSDRSGGTRRPRRLRSATSLFSITKPIVPGHHLPLCGIPDFPGFARQSRDQEIRQLCAAAAADPGGPDARLAITSLDRFPAMPELPTQHGCWRRRICAASSSTSAWRRWAIRRRNFRPPSGPNWCCGQS